MQVIADLSIEPLGVGASISKYIAACQRVLEEAELTHHVHATGTEIQGEWDQVLAAVKRCHDAVHQMGAPRIASTLRIDSRTDRTQSIDESIQRVAQAA